MVFIEQKDNDKENDNNIIVIVFFLLDTVIVIVFFLTDKGHEAENLQKECLFLLYYHFPVDDSDESFKMSWFSMILS